MEAIESIEDPTLRFFLEGEAMEKAARRAEAERTERERGPGFAGRFGNDNGARLWVPDTPEPVPQRRGHGGAIAFAGLSSLTAIGVAAWMWLTPPVRPALWWLTGPEPSAAVTETTAPTTPAPAAVAATATTEQKAPALPAEGAAPAVAPVAAAAALPAQPAAVPARTAPAASPPDTAAARAPAGPIIEQLPAPAPAVAEEEKAPMTERRSGRGEALRGYVWSPAAQAMVSTDGSAEQAAAATTERPTAEKTTEAMTPPAPSNGAQNRATAKANAPAAPTSNSDSVMAPASLSGPGIAPPTTGPAPDETARVPSTEPAPFEPGAAPAKSLAPIID